MTIRIHLGKTTAAQLVCEHLNFQFIEKNASDQRSKKLVSTLSSDSHSVAHFTNKSSMSNCVLIMDEVDGVAGNEDRGGIQELISLIKRSRIPIICICNDRQHKKIRSLANYCYDLRFYRPTIQQIRGAMMSVLHREHVHQIKQDLLDEIIKSCNQDIRQTLHSLNLWAIDGETNACAATMINKVVNNNPFELCRLSFSDDLRTKSLSDKIEIFFSDYQLMPLLIQENYLQCQATVTSTVDSQKRKITDIEQMTLLANAAENMCLGDVCSQMIYSKNESWSLLPYQV
jgi:replication factor C subunit 1